MSQKQQYLWRALNLLFFLSLAPSAPAGPIMGKAERIGSGGIPSMCAADFTAQLQGIYGQQYGGGRGTIQCEGFPVTAFQLFFYHELRNAVGGISFRGTIRQIPSQSFIGSPYLQLKLQNSPISAGNGAFQPLPFDPVGEAPAPELVELQVDSSTVRTNREYFELSNQLASSIRQTTWLIVLDPPLL